MKKQFDFSLYLVTDQKLSLGRPIEDVVRAAVKGGVTAVQIREKESTTKEFIKLAHNLQNILKPQGVPLIVNDRIDIALAVDADGIHIGQTDMPYYEARRLVGNDMVIGLSVETMEQAIEAENLDVDYISVSPVFLTPTKHDATNEWGLEGLRKLRSQSRKLLIAIGEINSSNAKAALESGADGIAVVSAICSAADPESASRRLGEIIEQTRKEKGIGK